MKTRAGPHPEGLAPLGLFTPVWEALAAWEPLKTDRDGCVLRALLGAFGRKLGQLLHTAGQVLVDLQAGLKAQRPQRLKVGSGETSGGRAACTFAQSLEPVTRSLQRLILIGRREAHLSTVKLLMLTAPSRQGHPIKQPRLLSAAQPPSRWRPLRSVAGQQHL
ncbi:hypothetical protein H920_15015 [Fukomys damarensis]|uniref:Uncharacterized protein n=1 Tax=Fukomys damarensis TaxID=885580 RepID=A0A091DLY9_FUKDA|nr:hypothetical protein H920_15015 [Fukomys damarensis]